MSIHLIVNADDFGLSEGVNYGIIKAFKDGIVASTSIMANMPSFDHAIQLAKQHPDLAIGVHLTLTAYKPVKTTHKNIVKEDGYFRSQNEIDDIDTEEAYEELKAQIEKVRQAGIPIDHFDSHHHIHSKVALQGVMERLYQEYQLPFRGGFAYESNMLRTAISDIRFYNQEASLQQLQEILHSLKDGTVTDLMCHPAYIDDFLYHITSYNLKRMEEVEILCSEDIKEYIQKKDITLTTYSIL